MIDLHCHLLPGIDDGAKSLAQALAMARIAVADGIEAIVVTPHHLNGVYDNPAAEVRSALAALRSELKMRRIALELLPGAELHLVPELPAELAAGRALTIADRGRAALVELPVHVVPLGAEALLEALLAMDIQPVIAHPERNGELASKPERLARWVQMGCLAQLTAQSLLGRFGPLAQRASQELLSRGLIHVVASDAHRDQRRIPELSPARRRIADWLGEDIARLLTDEHPRALLAGQPVDSQAMAGLRPARRRWWLW